MPSGIAIAPEVADALANRMPVVALESTIISHGLPRPENLRVAIEVEEVVRSSGAIPATIAVVDGTVHVGLDQQLLEQVAARDDIVKAGVRDLPIVVARSGSAATTVAATSVIAHTCGIEVFATGGLGGVHRQARDSWDESADLTTLASTAVTVVCSGVKSILDVGATLERMETLNITILGYRTSRFPGFYLPDSGHDLTWRVDDAAEVSDVMRSRAALGLTGAIVVANPIRSDAALDPDLHDATLAEGLQMARSRGIAGKDVTPFLLDHFHRATHGASLQANAELIVNNAELAARIASARKLVAGP